MKSLFNFNFGEIFSDDDDDDDDGMVRDESKIGEEEEVLSSEEEERRIRRTEIARKTKMFRDFGKNLDRVTSRAKELENLFREALSVSKYGTDNIEKRTTRKVKRFCPRIFFPYEKRLFQYTGFRDEFIRDDGGSYKQYKQYK